MKVYILECKPKTFFPIVSWLIRLGQRGLHFSHYALMVVKENGEVKTIDASGRSLHQEYIENFKLKYDILGCYEVSSEINEKDFFSWLYPLEGVFYGYSQLIGLLLMVLNLLRKNPFKNGINQLICNEFVLLFLKTYKIIEIDRIEDYDLLATHNLIEDQFKSLDINQIIKL